MRLKRLQKLKIAYGSRRGTTFIKRRILSPPMLLMSLITAAFVYFLITRFDPDWRATINAIARMNHWYYLLGFLLYYSTFILRGQRWRMLARNSGELETLSRGSLPTIWVTSSYILIGWFVNSIAWLRMGDGYRAWLFSRASGGSFSWSLGTLLGERVLDVISILLILMASVLLFSTKLTSNVALVVIWLTLAVGVGSLFLLMAMKMWGNRFARFLPSRLESEFHRFQSGSLGSLKQTPMVITLGVCAWILEVARLYFVSLALGLDAPLALISIAALSAAILSTVPIPGGIGFVESGIIGVLLLGLQRPEAVSIALVDRSITFVSIIAIGGVAFLVSQILETRQNSAEHT